MRIAFFSDNSYPELSGITDTILMTGRELKKRGHEVCFVAPRYSMHDYALSNAALPKTPLEDSVDGMPFIRLPSVHIPSPTGQSRFAFPTGASFTALHAFAPDIIHTHSPYGVGWEALKAATRISVPLIGTNHTAIEDFFPLAPLMRRYDAWYYNHCARVTTPYQILIERMRQCGLRTPAEVVANPVDLFSFAPPTLEERVASKKALNVNGPVVLYTGRVAHEKHIDVTIRALPLVLESFPTTTLVITGHGAALKSLRSVAKELGIEKRVRFTGFLKKEELARVYKAADVYVLMSTSDSQSISLMQAYASGIPAVCADARGLPDYTPLECGFVVPPGDVRALADKMIHLLSEDALRERMGAAAQNFVHKFRPELIAEQWEAIYRSSLPSFH